MVSKAVTKVSRVGSRHTLYLRKDLVVDSTFPFEVGEKLVVEIKGENLVIKREKPSARKPKTPTVSPVCTVELDQMNAVLLA